MNEETETVDCYDPLTNKWEEFTALPLAMEGMGVGSYMKRPLTVSLCSVYCISNKLLQTEK